MGLGHPTLAHLVSTALQAATWQGRQVLVTGHTGFKGTWLCLALRALGAEVHGLSLPAEPLSAFELVGLRARLASHHEADLRDLPAVRAALSGRRPSIVFHLAAQAIVSRGYTDPVGTFDTNVGGTLNLLEALRGKPGLQAVLVATTDKVYRNDETGEAFNEDAPLGGHDPYSASKAACEIAVASYRQSFGNELPPLVTLRAGNVIGGGDFGLDRLVPDLVRALVADRELVVRDPEATRPFQHVLDVVHGYLLFAQALIEGQPGLPAALNFGPREAGISVRQLLDGWARASGQPLPWRHEGSTLVERHRLALDSARARSLLGWEPALRGDNAVASTAAWYEAWRTQQDMAAYSNDVLATALRGWLAGRAA